MSSGLFAVSSATTAVIESAKGLGLTSIALSNYKSEVIENGDTNHSNAELKKVLDDVRSELATGMHHYNVALLMRPTTDDQKLSQFRHLHAYSVDRDQ